MTIQELIELMEKKINSPNLRKVEASRTGSIDEIVSLDKELDETTTTLNSLLQVSQS